MREYINMCKNRLKALNLELDFEMWKFLSLMGIERGRFASRDGASSFCDACSGTLGCEMNHRAPLYPPQH